MREASDEVEQTGRVGLTRSCIDPSDEGERDSGGQERGREEGVHSKGRSEFIAISMSIQAKVGQVLQTLARKRKRMMGVRSELAPQAQTLVVRTA